MWRARFKPAITVTSVPITPTSRWLTLTLSLGRILIKHSLESSIFNWTFSTRNFQLMYCTMYSPTDRLSSLSNTSRRDWVGQCNIHIRTARKHCCVSVHCLISWFDSCKFNKTFCYDVRCCRKQIQWLQSKIFTFSSYCRHFLFLLQALSVHILSLFIACHAADSRRHFVVRIVWESVDWPIRYFSPTNDSHVLFRFLPARCKSSLLFASIVDVYLIQCLIWKYKSIIKLLFYCAKLRRLFRKHVF